MAAPLLIAKSKAADLHLLPAMANRHGLIAGATGTGKTVTVETLAQGFSGIGVPVFLADVKGDLAGLSRAGSGSPRLAERLQMLKAEDFSFAACPAVFWDVFGKQGHPARATVSEMGPLLLGRMLDLNDVQQGVLTLVFKIADDAGLLLLDLKDLRAMLQHVGQRAGEFTTEYGNVSAASIGAIQRGLLEIEHQGGDQLFGEPALQIADLMRTQDGKGVVNILAADQLMNAPKLYAMFLLWLLSELFEHLPEVGDPEQPRLVFFFDEAHLLFDEAPRPLLQKIEQVVRLIRSKGVGVYFATQNPLDIPESVLGQLGNRVQHALRAFTPKDQKAVKAAAETLRTNPRLDVAAAITELSVGEALVSFLDEKGRPGVVERAFVMPPASRMGPISTDERAATVKASALYGRYENALDRESAYELLKARAADRQDAAARASETAEPAPRGGGMLDSLGGILVGHTGPRGGHHEGLVEAMARSTARTVGSQLGREVMRGILGSLLGGATRRR